MSIIKTGIQELPVQMIQTCYSPIHVLGHQNPPNSDTLVSHASLSWFIPFLGQISINIYYRVWPEQTCINIAHGALEDHPYTMSWDTKIHQTKVPLSSQMFLHIRPQKMGNTLSKKECGHSCEWYRQTSEWGDEHPETRSQRWSQWTNGVQTQSHWVQKYVLLGLHIIILSLCELF